jgi:hypothetical protein
MGPRREDPTRLGTCGSNENSMMALVNDGARRMGPTAGLQTRRCCAAALHKGIGTN